MFLYNRTMDKKIIMGVVTFAILALAIGLMIPTTDTPGTQGFPWQIELTSEGTTRVFGVTLGVSSLQQAEQLFHADAEISLFEPADKSLPRIVEAYFDKVNPGGLSAKVVAVIDIAPEQLQLFYEQGARINTLGVGSRRVTLNAENLDRVRAAPIASLTYLPRVRLDAALIEKRFGKPAQVVMEKVSESGKHHASKPVTESVKETNNKTMHWLYPDKGLDVALDAQGQCVLQYVPPAKFDQLRIPLE